MSINPEFSQAVWNIVGSIPRGHVASYGQVAALAGHPRRARLVGRVLAGLPEDTRLPWHRVLRADGRIAFPPGEPAHREQCARLREEGVTVTGGQVDLRRHQWRPA